MIEKRTDLAIEIRESFPEDDVEIEGVVLKEKFFFKKRIKNKSRWPSELVDG